ncbi:MAG: OmpW family protein [Candidatus Riflebacteria bacterium]|nr:OmpW family protein [Candidatus Riflebacteria bacterium]
MRNRIVLLALVGLVLFACGPVLADEEGGASGEPRSTPCGDEWRLRIRALGIFPAEGMDANQGLLLGANDIKINNKLTGEFDATYIFDNHVGLELSLPIPVEHTVDQKSTGARLGTFKQMPACLTLQYHFHPDRDFQPYLGAGLNYTSISTVNLGGLAGLDLDRSSWGAALQGGFDVKLNDKTFFNLDVKKVFSNVDLKQFGAKISNVQLDPWLIGVGVGFKL